MILMRIDEAAAHGRGHWTETATGHEFRREPHLAPSFGPHTSIDQDPTLGRVPWPGSA
jgi:hypothetical protein